MHRDLEISVPAAATDSLLEELKELEGVITLSVRRSESLKPVGDVIHATVLNSEADAVLTAVMRTQEHGPLSVATSSVDSVIDTEHHHIVRRDVDEAAWEEAETAMRRHTRPTLNFFLTTAGGGVVAAAGLASGNRVTEATALVAGAIIAPVFEPLVRVVLGVLHRQRMNVAHALGSVVIGYVGVIVVALLTMLILRAGGHGFVHAFLKNPTVKHDVENPSTADLLLSAAGAITGVVMVSAGRFTQLAGPLVALQLLPAAAALGMAAELGKGGIVTHSLARLAIDLGMVLIAGLLVFTYKHMTVHGGRRPPFEE